MSNNDKLVDCFATGLQIGKDRIFDGLTYNSIPEWDSIAHMALVAQIEEAFGIMLDTDDIIDMSSVAKAREILAKHDVSFS